ncbi:MAG: class I SAM-dependent methyltransferase [Rhizobiaceae bacterium]|nr:class I SAM-dependent methyltransferase [Rhizobiaceae bacterium]
MSGFSSEWLGLREPVDHAARSEEVISALRHYFLNDWKLVIADIGSGTGSTIRALRPVIGQDLTWHLIDHDDSLLAEARKHAEGDRVMFTESDLSQRLDAIFKPAPDLITTSAFLDLVSHDWLEKFVREVTIREIPFYAALSYDGRTSCNPPNDIDREILSAFNKHQQTDKGFGPALGPDAADTAIELFETAGYIVCKSKSDWKAGADHNEFQRQLLSGWREAAIEILPDSRQVFDLWLDERLALIDENENSVLVGHKDFLAVPKDR